MNKILHVLVYLFLILAAAGLYFEIQLNDKRALLTDRNRMQEDYIIRIAKTIEKSDAEKGTPLELKKDADPVENKIVDIPNTDNVLEDYNNYLEQANLETFSWDNQKDRQQLREVYVMDADGKPVMDGNQPLKTGRGTEDEMLSQLFEAAKAQQARLNTTRAELVTLRGKLDPLVSEINKLKPVARQDKVTIEEKSQAITKLEEEKAALQNEIVKVKGQIGELNTEITDLNDKLNTAKNETEEAREEVAKRDKLIDQMKKIIAESFQSRSQKSVSAGIAVGSIPAGNKGEIVEADNENMFAIVKFSPEALKELKGEDGKNALPALELGVRRKGLKGPAGDFVGKVRIRQEIPNKPYVVCDIVGDWSQAEDGMKAGDIIFAD